jgi:7-cyano-7-deazaguanine synthase
MKQNLSRVTVLLSGGIDSAATVAAYRKQHAAIDAIFVDYGQPARRSEWVAAQAIGHHFHIEIVRIRLGFHLSVRDGEFFGRNALLALAAAATRPPGPVVIAMGLHATSPYYDTTTSFVADIQRLLDGYSGGTITFSAPFLETDKKSVVQFARRHKVPFHLTYCCERRNAPACGKCLSCLDRAELNVD